MKNLKIKCGVAFVETVKEMAEILECQYNLDGETLEQLEDYCYIFLADNGVSLILLPELLITVLYNLLNSKK